MGAFTFQLNTADNYCRYSGKVGGMAVTYKQMGNSEFGVDNAWIEFIHEHPTRGALRDKDMDGWKAHLSLKTFSPEAMKEIAELAAGAGIEHFKVVNNADSARRNDKIATFYHTDNGADGRAIDWESFLTQLERVAERFGGGGPAIEGERKIAGSGALYYRNDKGRDGSYIDAETLAKFPLEQKFNPSGWGHDPFAGITIKRAHRPKHADLDVPWKEDVRYNALRRVMGATIERLPEERQKAMYDSLLADAVKAATLVSHEYSVVLSAILKNSDAGVGARFVEVFMEARRGEGAGEFVLPEKALPALRVAFKEFFLEHRGAATASEIRPVRKPDTDGKRGYAGGVLTGRDSGDGYNSKC